MVDDRLLGALQRKSFGTPAAILASGTAEGRMKMRFAQGRLPIPPSAATGTGNRRAFALADIYVLRLVEVLAGPGRVEVSAAVEVIRAAAGHDLASGSRDLDGKHVPADEASALSAIRTMPPDLWPVEWRSRDLTAPWWIVAKEYAFGWRVGIAQSIDVAHGMLPRPEDRPTGGSFAVVLNLTEELHRVDSLLERVMHRNDFA